MYKWQITKNGVNLSSPEMVQMLALFGSSGVLGGFLSNWFFPSASVIAAIASGFVSSWLLLTLSQIYGVERFTKEKDGEQKTHTGRLLASYRRGYVPSERHLRDVNEVATFF
ncbi:MAG: hypothetical protein EHM41_00960 [Chloroflexi bacterium]|nr:MAG: hypothetical protein EHM41_00960 [Chloroflexota bacterium]